MPIPKTYDFRRYLVAKKAIDDRSLNYHVWETMSRLITNVSQDSPLRVLEIGVGIGTMLERMLERGVLRIASYCGVDSSLELIRYGQDRLLVWGQNHGYHVKKTSSGGLRIGNPTQCVEANYIPVDVWKLLDKPRTEWGSENCRLLIAHSFLDLVDIHSILPRLFSLLDPDGLFYFSGNFDGVTILEPTIEPALDAQIEKLYHQTMDEHLINGKPSGNSRTGRRLISFLNQAGAQVLAAGSSDWVVVPYWGVAGPEGYPQDEAFFLHYILHFIERELTGHPQLDPARFEAWITERRAQVERGELVYIAHQLDVLGRFGRDFRLQPDWGV